MHVCTYTHAYTSTHTCTHTYTHSLLLCLECSNRVYEFQVDGHECFAGVHFMSQDGLDLGFRHPFHPAYQLTPLPLVLGRVCRQVIGTFGCDDPKDIPLVLLNVSTCVCMCVCKVRTYLYDACTYVCTCMYVHMYVCTTYICTYIHTYVHTRMYIHDTYVTSFKSMAPLGFAMERSLSE